MEPRREEREPCITRRMLGISPISPKTGEITILRLGVVYLECFYSGTVADNVKGNYDAKFLEAIYFAFKQCHFNFVPKAEQLQAIHALVTGNDVFVKTATGFGKSVCYINCCSFNMFVKPNLTAA